MREPGVLPPTSSEHSSVTTGDAEGIHRGGKCSATRSKTPGSLTRIPMRTPWLTIDNPAAHPRRSNFSSQVEDHFRRGQTALRSRAMVRDIPSSWDLRLLKATFARPCLHPVGLSAASNVRSSWSQRSMIRRLEKWAW